jgi:hypothetical protein
VVSELQGIARFKIHEGKLEEFKRLSAQCMEIVRPKIRGLAKGSVAKVEGDWPGVATDGEPINNVATGGTAYLEATSKRNRDLYERLGFRMNGRIERPAGPPLWAMWRDAVSA